MCIFRVYTAQNLIRVSENAVAVATLYFVKFNWLHTMHCTYTSTQPQLNCTNDHGGDNIIVATSNQLIVRDVWRHQNG